MEELLTRYPALKSCAGEIGKTAEILISGFKAGNKLMLCGNGGSCADCEHITGELMKGFLKKPKFPPKLSYTFIGIKSERSIDFALGFCLRV